MVGGAALFVETYPLGMPVQLTGHTHTGLRR